LVHLLCLILCLTTGAIFPACCPPAWDPLPQGPSAEDAAWPDPLSFLGPEDIDVDEVICFGSWVGVSLEGTGLWWYEICTAKWLNNDKNRPENAELEDR
jgi:hypothetical protein